MSHARIIPPLLETIITEQLAFIEADNRTFPEIENAFDTMLTAINENIAVMDARKRASDHDVIYALELMKTDTLALREKYLFRFRNATLYEVQKDSALWELALLLYRDVDRVDLLVKANSIADYFRVRKGTTIVVLPVS